MKILFITIGQIHSLNEKSVHIDLIKALQKHGHEITVLCSREKRYNLETELSIENECQILRLKIGNITRCSLIEKGFNTLRIERQFISAIKKYFAKIDFDLVIYNTPPITLANVIKFCKKKYKSHSYLMLKDIFPQNAVDIGLISKTGLLGLLYRMFRAKETKLYKYSDRIGCMSNANVEYLLRHNPEISRDKVEIFPNAVAEASKISKDKDILTTYGLDKKKLTFIYGGNLGKPQGLEFLARALRNTADCDCNFVIVGSGQDKKKLFERVKDIANVYTFDYIPHDEYNRLCAACDIGMIMLDYRFTIPNYPSRVLSYMENAMPVFACTDESTDIKQLVLTEAKCGKWCNSCDVDEYKKQVEWFITNRDELLSMGRRGREYLLENFVTDICVDKLEKFMKKEIANV